MYINLALQSEYELSCSRHVQYSLVRLQYRRAHEEF